MLEAGHGSNDIIIYTLPKESTSVAEYSRAANVVHEPINDQHENEDATIKTVALELKPDIARLTYMHLCPAA